MANEIIVGLDIGTTKIACFVGMRGENGKVKILVSELNDRERDVLGASALAWSVPEYSLFK